MNVHARYALATHRRLPGSTALVALCALAALTTACGGDTSDAGGPETAAVAESSAPDTPAPTTTAASTTIAPTTVAPTTVTPTTQPAPRVVVAKGTFGDVPGTTAVGAANADGTTPLTGSLALTGDLVATARFENTLLLRDAEGDLPYIGDWVVEGTLVGVGDGTFSVHEEGVFVNDGSQGATGTVVGLTGVFEGATGTLTYTGTSAAQADYEFTFEWPG